MCRGRAGRALPGARPDAGPGSQCVQQSPRIAHLSHRLVTSQRSGRTELTETTSENVAADHRPAARTPASHERPKRRAVRRGGGGRAHKLRDLASASSSPPGASQRPENPVRTAGPTLHYNLVTAVPELRGNRIVLNAHTGSEAAAHAAGEDEETARRFGWWPGKRDQGHARSALALLAGYGPAPFTQ
jgi:hypothetical protein